MLTGFNTDIKHAERVYHVQTEDRGPSNPVVESLVYVGGEILLSKKSPYGEHVHGDRIDEKAVRELMYLQHRKILEAIRRGRLDQKKPGETAVDLSEDTFPVPPGVSPAAVAAVAAILAAPVEPLPGDSRSRPTPKERSGVRPAGKPASGPATQRPASGVRPSAGPRAAPAAAVPGEQRVPPARGAPGDGVMETVVSSSPSPKPPETAPTPVSQVPAPPRPAPDTAPRPGVVAAPPAAQRPPAVVASGPGMPTPAPFPSAVAPAARPAAPSTAPAAAPPAAEPPRKTPVSTSGPKSLDQVIVEYLASEAASERLELSVMAGGDFVSGSTVPLTVIASTSITRKAIAGAQVTIRVVSTGGPPQILFRGLTGNDGMVKTSCALPEVGTGNAALIIVGFSPIGSSESKYLIRKKGS